ncbi:NAD(P)/FAD-dependent oxidoreductase [Wenzhouxiangella sp. XN79A]|uniref:NAD(P)/FAD-dependent oxidoreductase n=1 Tax=Wenzhouxiangella sp. XN79A TaxID=2724193 RepID=UPI00144ACA13|nr:NAD(P)/FAD-dependent oxidoreductase [Wenzhouxiangella sp. XN79A]NKI36334.1 NAD(P)/FAD-dependent oxidoreductase [Wenzhouxiangella sp. XN79A]
MKSDAATKIVIVGGGSGGLKLATRLGRRYRRDADVAVTLVDGTLTHVWKPLLHEIAAGTLDIHEDECNYLAHARRHHFRFVWGRMQGLDTARRRIVLEPLDGNGDGNTVPTRELAYDVLVLAVGGISDDFGVPGVAEHCYRLDSAPEAERFRRSLLEAYLRAGQSGVTPEPGDLDVAIVGGGATGVELAAELDKMRHELNEYGAVGIDTVEDTRMTLIERVPRLLPGLPEELAASTERELVARGIDVRTGEAVSKVTAEGVYTASDEFIPACFSVWAAGIRGQAFLSEIEGIEVNRRNQVQVKRTLQTTTDERIFALGDCAACPLDDAGSGFVPPRAQAADQQSKFLAAQIPRFLADRELEHYVYKDRGSLVSLDDTAVGTLMGALMGNVNFEGWAARFSYRMLYRSHQRALHGSFRTLVLWISDIIGRRTKPRLKLH